MGGCGGGRGKGLEEEGGGRGGRAARETAGHGNPWGRDERRLEEERGKPGQLDQRVDEPAPPVQTACRGERGGVGASERASIWFWSHALTCSSSRRSPSPPKSPTERSRQPTSAAGTSPIRPDPVRLREILSGLPEDAMATPSPAACAARTSSRMPAKAWMPASVSSWKLASLAAENAANDS